MKSAQMIEQCENLHIPEDKAFYTSEATAIREAVIKKFGKPDVLSAMLLAYKLGYLRGAAR